MVVLECLGIFLLAAASRAGPVVQTSQGLLEGRTLLSRNGREYAAFTKVPFGKPPLANLRFMPPVPSGPWNGTLDATHESPACIMLTTKPVGEEDCLYLNIYTPKVNVSGDLPVMVYFYGGGWRVGSPGPSSVSKFFMDEDVVLVMPNYRLGPFGFLSTEDHQIPGNMGLKDMALALEWTKREIGNFGGNPQLMTAFGLSAGGASVHYLCSLPKTRGLLKGCISESGVGGAFWSLLKPGTSRDRAFKVAMAVRCFGNAILHCLQSKTPEQILGTQHMLKSSWEDPLILYGPVLERKSNNSLLSEWPTESDFPWLTGITSNEGILKSGEMIIFHNVSVVEEQFMSSPYEYIIKMLGLVETRRDCAKNIFQRFFKGKKFLQGIEELYSEAHFVQPALKALSEHKGPKYFFVFDYTEGPLLWELYTKKKLNITTKGACHGDNYYYFFDTHLMPGHLAHKTKDVQLSNNLIKLWVNFAKYQKPSPDGNPVWQPYGENNEYLYIGNSEFTMKQYQNVTEILEFWKTIF